MKIAFRIECPHCRWGIEWKDNYVNQGWVALTCHHCKKESFTKIYIPIVNVETQIEPPDYCVNIKNGVDDASKE